MNPTPADQREFDEAIQKAMALSQARLDRESQGRAGPLRPRRGLRAAVPTTTSWYGKPGWTRCATRPAARKLHNKVTELDPSIVDARLVQGMHDYVVGSLPWHIKLVGFLAGFRGDRDGRHSHARVRRGARRPEPRGRRGVALRHLPPGEAPGESRALARKPDLPIPSQLPVALRNGPDVCRSRRRDACPGGDPADRGSEEFADSAGYNRLPHGEDLLRAGHDPILVQRSGPGAEST